MGKLGRHSNAERLEKFHKLWESMNELGVPVIVEGKRDISAIRQLGYNGNLIQLNDGKSVLNTVEGIIKLFDKLDSLFEHVNKSR